ncbi:MAG: hypothetical protein J6023_00590 [Clostridia bacterium]|nr:hypothetical protein [Clostridia bacterium]
MLKKTHKLYDQDSHLYTFTARVESCEKTDHGFALVLDRTAFFPEGGGQESDTGTLNGIRVRDVRIRDGIIFHDIDQSIPEGTEVIGIIEESVRFARMQMHSAEHILSGLAFKFFGCDNVGFHLTDKWCTIDWNRVLTREQLDQLETEANRIVAANLDVTARYPSPEELEKIAYRSKIELTEDVRLVCIPDVDVCACCAPHVNKTGEIGIIKILDFQHYKGGVRVFMVAGSAALEDYRLRYENAYAVSGLLSAPQDKITQAVQLHLQSEAELKMENNVLRKKIAELLTNDLLNRENAGPVLCLVLPFCEMNTLRSSVNELTQKTGKPVCGLCQNPDGSYAFIIGHPKGGLKALLPDIMKQLKGKGGGSDVMVQGTIASTPDVCEKVINQAFSQFLKETE